MNYVTEVSTVALPSITLVNHTGKTLKAALWGLLKKAMRRGYTLTTWHNETPCSRLSRGEDWTAEVFEDGSGFEVTYDGKIFTLGVMPKARARDLGDRLYIGDLPTLFFILTSFLRLKVNEEGWAATTMTE